MLAANSITAGERRPRPGGAQQGLRPAGSGRAPESVSGGAIGGITSVGGAYLPGSHGYSFAGMLTGLPAGAGLGLFCSGTVGPSNVQWWVSPIGS
jgi:hypothetical protein